ncbi:MAG: hypothetical protein NDJ75_07120 [Thermoanaerobaculia bacterium]|nr:hypothetical protein [Thermoanaerobaculia bacterium]
MTAARSAAAVGQTLGYARSFAQFPFHLRRFLAETPSPAACRRAVAERLLRRDERFLEMVEHAVLANPRSPYRVMFEMAGWDAGRLRDTVKAAGVESALGALHEAGVYVSFEELKGRRPIVRRGRQLEFAPRDFDNPVARHDLSLTTSGSTGLANVVYQDLDHIAEMAESELVALDLYGVADAPSVHWTHILPGSGVRYVLQRARHGQRAQRWFTPMGWRASRYWLKYGAATRYMLGWMRRFGVDVAPPPHVPPGEAATVARAVREALDREGRCLLRSTVSLTVRVCAAAQAAGFDLAGATVRLASEPLTAVQRERIEATGATVLAGYGSVETGAMALGCRRPARADEVHLLRDAYALIARPHELPGRDVTVSAFHLTDLRVHAAKVLLNYRIDDCGVVEARDCGCGFEALGYSTHLHSIRSYGKLVSEGVTLIGSDLLPVLEEALPRRFGGSALDYQLQEREDAAGLPRLVLVVSPRVAAAEAGEIAAFVLAELRASSPMGDAAGSIWREAETLEVERGEPVAGARGKLLPLWSGRPPGAARPR